MEGWRGGTRRPPNYAPDCQVTELGFPGNYFQLMAPWQRELHTRLSNQSNYVHTTIRPLIQSQTRIQKKHAFYNTRGETRSQKPNQTWTLRVFHRSFSRKHLSRPQTSHSLQFTSELGIFFLNLYQVSKIN